MSVRQIAKMTGLSPAAVSMALRHSPKISAATRRRVSRSARLINYQPDAKVAELMARLRSSKQSRREACFAVMSFFDNPRPWERSRHMTRIWEGMKQRAATLGYRLEPLWLRAPDMNLRRFRSILDARGINGILCFGSPNVAEEVPPEFDHYAIVTVGASIKSPLHRVTSHMFNDMTQALHRVHERGYRRPGLVLGHATDLRSQHIFLSAYLGWCDHMIGGSRAVPVLRLQDLEPRPLARWLRQHDPDVLVFVHTNYTVRQFAGVLAEQGLKIPEERGVAVLGQFLEGTGFSGMQQNQAAMGGRAVELLIARTMNLDFGLSDSPRIEMVESQWIDGTSLRPAQVAP